jgi:protein TonB
MSPYLAVHITEEQKLKDSYPRVFRVAAISAIALHLLAFLFVPAWDPAPYRLRERQVIEAIEIPDQFKIPPPPKEEVKKQVVTEIEPTADASEEETIESTDFDVDAPPELPPAPSRPDFFDAYDEPPQITKQVEPVYPEMAIQSELEGVVMLRIGVDEFGNVVEVRVVNSVPGLDQAAIDAVYQWKFRPAKQRDVPVPVRIVVPVRFQLRG